jgi:exodeoxyribonuclease VII small subunit
MEQKSGKIFEENYKRLELLSQQLQENRLSVDELVPRMKEALLAIKACKEVLKETKLQLEQISEEFASEKPGIAE